MGDGITRDLRQPYTSPAARRLTRMAATITRGRRSTRSTSRGPRQSSVSPKSDAIQLTRAFTRNMIVASGTATVGTTALTTSGELDMSTVAVDPDLLAVLQLIAAVQ